MSGGKVSVQSMLDTVNDLTAKTTPVDADEVLLIDSAASNVAKKVTGANLKTYTSNAPTLVTPNIGVATGTSLAATGLIKSSGTAGIGYATGAGGTVTQATSKSTGVTLNKICGDITMHNASLGSDTLVSFVLTNSTIAAGDVLVLNHVSAGTPGKYMLNATGQAAGSCTINVRNISGTGEGAALVIRFAVIKAVSS